MMKISTRMQKHGIDATMQEFCVALGSEAHDARREGNLEAANCIDALLADVRAAQRRFRSALQAAFDKDRDVVLKN